MRKYSLDLGAGQMRVAVDGKIVYSAAPTLLKATQNQQILTIGAEADPAFERAPDHMIVECPLSQGRISNRTLIEPLLRYALARVTGGKCLGRLVRPSAWLSVPAQAADYELRALEDTAHAVGFGKVTLVEEILAHARGADWPIDDPCLVVVIGAAYAQAGILRDGRVAFARGLHAHNPLDGAAGEAFNRQLRQMIRQNCGLQIGRDQADQILLDSSRRVIGYSEQTGKVEEITLSDADLAAARGPVVARIAHLIARTLEEGTLELGDVAQSALEHRPVLLTGGCAGFAWLKEALQTETKLDFTCAENPRETAIRGLMKMEAEA